VVCAAARLEVLFSGLDGKTCSRYRRAGAAGIPYEMTADGTECRSGGDVDKARMEVAAKGMRRRDGWIELFDKPNWVGSEFDERVNYQRALEGELEHTIGRWASAVARVHLVLPQPSLFLAQEKIAKASCMKLKRAAMNQDADESASLVHRGALQFQYHRCLRDLLLR